MWSQMCTCANTGEVLLEPGLTNLPIREEDNKIVKQED